MKKIFLFLFLPVFSFSQNIDNQYITNIIKGDPFKVSGQISANSVYYNANRDSNRMPLTYFLQGVLNVSSFSFSMPIEYSFSNQGGNLDYELPFDYNTLSFHPSYKSITGHLGTVTMSFSPYTMDNHQFTGGGIDFTPSKSLVINAMGGELRKGINDDGNPQTTPSYSRMGYGLKTYLRRGKYSIGFIGFYAKDDKNSIDSIPEARNILPKENLVLSVQGEIKIAKNYIIEAEYASTAITQDVRASNSSITGFSPAGFFLNNHTSTQYHHAVKARLGYDLKSVNLGIGYERIDPGYETLGAYFFNNDFENITLDLANTFFKNKLSISLNIGYQRDNLDNAKVNSTNRTIGSINAQAILSDKITLVGSYSDFTTYTNTRPNQFDDVNDADLLDEQIEELNYRQLSRNATLSMNYLVSVKKKSTQNLSINYALNDVANEQDGNVRLGDVSSFHNLSAAHTINFAEDNLSISTAVNATYNTIGREETTTWGPTLSVGKRFFNKKLNSRFGASYNQSNGISGNSKIANCRINFGYVLLEHHNFNLNAIQLFRTTDQKDNFTEFTATFGYNYTFGLKKPKINFKRRERVQGDSIKIRYRKYYFEGLPKEITPKLMVIPVDEGFKHLITRKEQELNRLEEQLIENQEKDKRVYKEVALAYLKKMDAYFDFIDFYDKKILESYQKLVTEARLADRQLRDEYIVLTAKINSSEQKNQEDLERQNILEKRYESHTKLLNSLIKWNLEKQDVENPTGEIKILKEQNASKVFTMYHKKKSEKDIVDFIEIQLADLYHKVLTREP
ncbi:hypothetical protein [uncultured Aquimarina sp.]|uniref:hypothetical protein n=1 Tax=uncultured Aquimarina sp. TaxID=575652 RepID=UPI002615D9B4|nr:hypothetical protein [uncultured Aquimarina sp.]